jgi:hypothetical protein
MRKGISYFITALLLVFATACHRDLKPVAYVSYIQGDGNGLKKTIIIDKWEYTMQYKPYDYIIMQETKGKAAGYDINKRRAGLKGTAWFNITFKLADGHISPLRYDLASRDDYDRRFNYFLNQAVHSIQLVYDSKDTLYPTDYLFENNYNLTPQETMVVGFELPGRPDKPQKDMQLCYNDQVFKNGIIKAFYKSKDLNNIPNLIN